MSSKSIISRGFGFLGRMVRGYILVHFPTLGLRVIPAVKRHFIAKIHMPLIRAGILKSSYDRWMQLESKSASNQEIAPESLPHQPLISIVMPVYNVPLQWLEKAVASVRAQTYGNWELCIADDGSTRKGLREYLQQQEGLDQRVRINFLDKNLGISGASNAALAMAKGEFIGLLDNDDELAPNALAEMVKVINETEDADCIYSDEDKISETGKRYEPFFKPDWSPDTLRSYNYICHFTVIRKSLLDQVGGFRTGFDGSQDYDLFLRVTEQARNIVHIPKILYHWRAIAGSTGQRGDAKMYAYTAAKKALTEHLERINCKGEVYDGNFLGSYQIRYEPPKNARVDIIIPSKDQVGVLRRCIDSILLKTRHPHYRIVVVDNNSQEKETFAYYEELRKTNKVILLRYDKPFNFSAINNYAASRTDGDFILFLNNDTEVLSANWLQEMLGLAARQEMGAVGCQLYYPNETVQHAGIIMGIGGVAGHSHKYFLRNDLGYFGKIKICQNLSGVTAACLLIKRKVFEEVGGFEEELSHAFNDVDLCLKIRQKGYLITYTPFVELYHYESASRGYENSPEKKARFNKEIAFCQAKWKETFEAGDPYYNPNLSLEREDFSLRL
ncbi:MAG: glycosyltransferase [Desulfobulbaceae bacterium]|nr:glycosyltransferase [Desulfobulbaceae bacterium]